MGVKNSKLNLEVFIEIKDSIYRFDDISSINMWENKYGCEVHFKNGDKINIHDKNSYENIKKTLDGRLAQ